MAGESRVVGEAAAAPTCRNVAFAILFVGNLLAVLGLCFTFLSNPSFNLEAMADTAIDAVQGSSIIPSDLVSASALTTAFTFLFSIVFLFVYLLFMKRFSYFLVVGLNIICIAVAFALGIQAITNASELEEYTGSPDSMYIMYACGGLLIAMALLGALWMWCIRGKIKLTAQMLSQVATVLFLVPGVMTVSFLMAMAVAVWAMAWCPATVQTNILYFNSYNSTATDESAPYGGYIGLTFLMLLSGFWGYQVFVNMSQTTTASVVAWWYWQPSSAEDGVPFCRPVVIKSFGRAATYFLGPIAFGSFLVAIVQALYWTVKMVFDKASAGESSVAKLAACCVLCCINCLKNCIEWLTEFAYVYVAIYGSSFFTAGKSVMAMLGKAGLTALASTSLVEPVIYLGRFLGAAVGVGAGYLSLQVIPLDQGSWFWSQLALGAVLGFGVASTALSCVASGMKTLLVCFADDPEPMVARAPDLHFLIHQHVRADDAKGKEDTDITLARP